MTPTNPLGGSAGLGVVGRIPAEETPVRARIPADLDTPDRVLAGFTARQVAILAAAAVPLYLTWQALAGRVPVVPLSAATAAVAAVAVAAAVGSRDGVPLDMWLLAAIIHRHGPRHRVPQPDGIIPEAPGWAPQHDPEAADPGDGPVRHARRGPGAFGGERPPRLGVLRLPADAVDDSGVITTGSSAAVALVAAGTVTANLHTAGEQAALVAGHARWLNGLNGPVQIVVSTRRADLTARARRVAESSRHLPDPELARAAGQHARFLLALCDDGEPLARRVTVACTAPGAGGSGAGEALRRAGRTAAALATIGSRCRVLDGPQATGVLTTAVDPYAISVDLAGPRARPGQPITAREPTGDPDADMVRDGVNDGIGDGVVDLSERWLG